MYIFGSVACELKLLDSQTPKALENSIISGDALKFQDRLGL